MFVFVLCGGVIVSTIGGDDGLCCVLMTRTRK